MYSKAHKKSKSCLMRVITTTQRRFSATFCRIYLLHKVSLRAIHNCLRNGLFLSSFLFAFSCLRIQTALRLKHYFSDRSCNPAISQSQKPE